MLPGTEIPKAPSLNRKSLFVVVKPVELWALRKQVYTLIGNEPFAACMERIAEV
jgi:hypothetical protein